MMVEPAPSPEPAPEPAPEPTPSPEPAPEPAPTNGVAKPEWLADKFWVPEEMAPEGKIDFEKVATVGLVPPTYSAGRTPGKYPIPNVSRIQSKVRDVIENGVTAQSRSGESECS